MSELIKIDKEYIAWLKELTQKNRSIPTPRTLLTKETLNLWILLYIFISNKTRHGTPSGTAPGRVVLFIGAVS